MKRVDRVLDGDIKVYPSLNNKIINLKVGINMRDSFNVIFNENIDYDERIKRILSDDNYKQEIVDKVKKHYHLYNYELITDASYDEWYFVSYDDSILNRLYMLHYAETLAELNRDNFFEDYEDLFGNKIKFLEYSY